MSNTSVIVKDFQTAYPLLWKHINQIRLETGSKELNKDYSDDSLIPINMHDASIAESFLSKNQIDDPLLLGYTQYHKIARIVHDEPDIMKWSNMLYKITKPSKTKKIKKEEIKQTNEPKKEDNTMARNNKVADELIGFVTKNENGYTATTETGQVLANPSDETSINQKKLKYAFDNKGVVRGRADSTGTLKWRVVKERFISDTSDASGEVENVSE